MRQHLTVCNIGSAYVDTRMTYLNREQVVDVERRTFVETIVVFNLTAFQYSICL